MGGGAARGGDKTEPPAAPTGTLRGEHLEYFKAARLFVPAGLFQGSTHGAGHRWG